MFFGTFAWSFVYVSLPFHIQRMSAWEPSATLRWTGWILGISPLVTVATAPLWGRFAGQSDPKRFYVVVEMLQGTAFFGMALARTLPELFLARFLLGFMGAASTFAFIIAGRSTEPAGVRRQVAAVQSAMTVGQIIGPLAGAIVAARIGFRESFVVGGLILLGCALAVHRGAPSSPAPAARPASARRTRWRDVVAVALVVLGGSTQIFFLPAILPEILPGLGIPPERTLEVGGLVIFASGVAAALGAFAAPRLAEMLPERRLLALLLVASSASVLALALAPTAPLYGALRFLQMLFIAPVFPIVVARVAQSAGGEAIGVVNAARIGAAFVGPVVATTVLAWTGPSTLYALLAVIGLASVPLAAARDTGPRRTPSGTP